MLKEVEKEELDAEGYRKSYAHNARMRFGEELLNRRSGQAIAKADEILGDEDLFGSKDPIERFVVNGNQVET